MTDHQLNDGDIKALFGAVPDFPDQDAFSGRVMRGLNMKLWLRGGLVALAGFIGGVYALAQFVRMPGWSTGMPQAKLVKAAAETDHTLRASFKFMDVAGKDAINLVDASAHYLDIMQKPVFFWVSFALCLCVLGLYYAYSQEETI